MCHAAGFSLDVLGWWEEECNTSITKSQRSRAAIPSIRRLASREIISASVELCETEVCFLHIHLMETNVRLPKMHRTPPDDDFESSKSSCKVRVLKQSQPALLRSVSHRTILFVFTCLMSVRNQTSQAFVTSFGPFCD